jgi:transcriptional regulator with XRE-family HTH domain
VITGEQVAARRASRGLSRRTLAELTNLTEGKIWRIENRNILSEEEAEALAAALPADSAEVPLSPVRPPETQPDPPSTDVGTSQPGDNLILLEALPALVGTDSEVNVEPLPCGHTVRDHGVDDLCPRHPRNEGVRLISNSELRTFKRCRRKWWLAWFRGLRPAVESPVGALAIGQRVHRALREWYVAPNQRRTDPRSALEVFITSDWTAVTRSYATNGVDVPLELRKKFISEADLERAMLEGYVEWLAETGEDSELEVIAPETYLEAEVTADITPLDQRVKLIGKIDVRTHRKRDGVRRFLDHKTVADMRGAVAVLPLDEQMLHYHLLEWLSTEDGQAHCDAALYNMLRKVKRSPTAQPPFYQRVTVHHSTRELKSYQTRVLATVEDVMLAGERLSQGDSHLRWAYPNATKDCRWDCPFFQACSLFDDGSRVEEMLEQYYVRGDVLAYYVENNGLRALEGEIV